jgi:hypothetical protein
VLTSSSTEAAATRGYDRLTAAIDFYVEYPTAARTLRPRVSRKKVVASAVMGAASQIVEVMLLGWATGGVADDQKQAPACAELIGKRGAAADRLVNACEAKARRIFREQWPAVESLARAWATTRVGAPRGRARGARPDHRPRWRRGRPKRSPRCLRSGGCGGPDRG